MKMTINKNAHETLRILLRNIDNVDCRNTEPFWGGPLHVGFGWHALDDLPDEKIESFEVQFAMLDSEDRFDTLSLYTHEFVDWIREVWFWYRDSNG